MNNYTQIKLYKNKNDNKFLVQEADQKFISIESYRQMVREEFEQGIHLLHRNILQYRDIKETDENIYLFYDYVPAIKLNDALLNKNFHTNNVKDSRNIILQLLDAVEYLHKNRIYHLNIKPENILIRKSGNQLFLYNFANTYINNSFSYFIFHGEYCAPECFSENYIPSAANDIYSIGKIVSLVYSYSKLSFGINRIIKKATNKNPENRYKNIGEIRTDLLNANKINISVNLIKFIPILLLFFIGFKECDKSNECDVNFEINKFNNDLETNNDFDNSQDVCSLDSINIHNDTTTNIIDKYNNLCEKSFRDEYSDKAKGIIDSLYSKESMNGNKEQFIKHSKSKINELDTIQKELAIKYGISPYYAVEISSDVISKLTDARIKYLKNQKR